MSLFKGAGVALITPFNEDNSVNYEMLRTLVKRQIDGGTDAIIVCGTTGEPATMTEEEKLSVIKCVVDETAGQIPVIAGTGANCTQNVIDFSQKVEKLGVDGLLVVTPYYNKATQNGLLTANWSDNFQHPQSYLPLLLPWNRKTFPGSDCDK